MAWTFTGGNVCEQLALDELAGARWDRCRGCGTVRPIDTPFCCEFAAVVPVATVRRAPHPRDAAVADTCGLLC